MHVIMVIVGGVALLGIFVLFGWLWGTSAYSMVLGAKVFVPVWLLVALINMWVGMAFAGYTLRQEAPILLIVFVVPTIVAATLAWQLSRG